MSEPLRIGVVGYGWFADLLREHAFDRIDELEVVAVCDPTEAARERGAHALGVPAFADLDSMFEGSACDGVVILTPHDTHRALVEAAAAAGKHVFCEKAMAVQADDCDAMVRACEQAGVVLIVGHMQKLFPPYARVIELARGGDYGEPQAVQVFGWHWSPVFEGWWRRRERCGGLTYWTGVHDIDTVRHVLADEAESVFAAAGPKTEGYTDYEDIVSATIRFRRGALVTMQVCPHDPLRDFEHAFSMAVLCESGAIRFDPVRNVVEHRGRGGFERGPLTVEEFPPHEECMAAAYREEFAHFVDVARGRAQPRLSGEGGRRCVQILQAIEASLRAGEPVAVQGG